MFKSISTLSLKLTLLLTISCSTPTYETVLPTTELIPKSGQIPNTVESEAVVAAVEEGSEAIISLEAKSLDDPKSESNCNLDEPSNAHRCSLVQNNKLLIADDQQLIARGNSRCLAKSALEAKLFSEKILKNGAVIECHPDATPLADCTALLEQCDKAPESATRCFAKEIDSSEVTWTTRPEAWGKSECEARNNLRLSACNKGIAPSEMTAIACEKEVSPVVCPPIQQNCLVQGNDLVECRIRKIGDVPLKESLKGFGSTTCEASYRVKDLACRWQRKTISDLNAVECRSISKGEAFPLTTAKRKSIKKIKKLQF